jgi:glycyl-tRNA synthetase beta chain
MTDFLLELRSEEIPARMQDDARQNLARLFVAELAKAGLKAENIATYATPRRLALIAYGLPLETEAVSEETKGPKVGAPPQALEGFLRKSGLTQDQLVERDGVYFAVVEKAGRATADVLAAAIEAIIRNFPWPKSMRWGATSTTTEMTRWVRPLEGIVALFGQNIIRVHVADLLSGGETRGHRFHHSGEITIANAASYSNDLRAAHVILDQDERRTIIREGAERVASDAGLTLVPDEGLVNENSGLTEWPVPMLGRFDPAFLEVPEEVIQLTARVNQKYFICRDAGGKLANAFVCTANISAHDGGAAIVAGNEKVLAARLSDAKFFWEQDLKVSLEDQAQKLSAIVFHEKLGTVADKVERVAKLARWLVEEGIVKSSPLAGEERDLARNELSHSGEGVSEGASLSPAATKAPASPSLTPSPARGEGLSLADAAERAARLCKADLVTGMVGEFPELQGIMGGYYARAQGEDDAVADAIRDHYKPVGQGDDVPTAPVTVVVSLADKLDTIVCFFAIDERPTGSKDPFALRRAALGLLALVQTNGLRLSLVEWIKQAHINYVIKIVWKTEFYILSTSNYGGDGAFVNILGDETTVVYDNNLVETMPTKGSPLIEHHVNIQHPPNSSAILDFLADRLKVQQREAGVRHDLIDAVFVLGGEDDLVRLLARVKALQAFVGTDEGVNLLAGYKRAANILKAVPSPLAGEERDLARNELSRSGEGASEGASPSPAATKALASPSLTPSPAGGEGHEELTLLNALNSTEPLATAAIEAEDFEAAMAALASLRAPIDAFFEGVMVNDPDPDKRAFRIGLLTRFRDAVHTVADFSKIEG